jgi:hypothetical protein
MDEWSIGWVYFLPATAATMVHCIELGATDIFE